MSRSPSVKAKLEPPQSQLRPAPIDLAPGEEALWDDLVTKLSVAWIQRGILGPSDEVGVEAAILADSLILERRLRKRGSVDR